MICESLERYRPVKSPWHARFREWQIPYHVVGRFCGVSPGRIAQIVNGFTGTPEHIEEKFRELEHIIEQEMTQ
ncbi:hypothetical protein [Pseudodesulfovibrio portus]|uniref:XRE family transcriptional regulator n=1 Tax=Pseudodesulfovibrio portus TaxID=231439 RepID=A0ABM8AQF6_9BACT|nr:hypothetical protein [Pseudodesulfovibrio portus]BDQ33583.1 hypothetical protein JCM14722_11250 [Pseudodesulfovibrio portus]